MWLWLPEALRGEARETPTEEVANALTHLVGLLLASLGMYFLVIAAIVFRHSWHHVVGLLLFGISTCFSTHALEFEVGFCLGWLEAYFGFKL